MDTPRKMSAGNSAEDIGTSGARGIFIPYEKLLENIDHKLDRIADKIEDLSRSKVDNSTFDSFRTSYEQRHDRLSQRVSSVEGTLEERIASLERDKAGRQAVESYKRWLIGGGTLAVFATLLNLINIVLVHT